MLILGRYALALAIGALGGWVFILLEIPLAWMLGAMTFTMVCAIMGAPVAGPEPLRGPTVSILGVLLGSGFTPDVIADAQTWPLTLAGLLLFVAIAGGAAVVFLIRVGGFDRTTAYFSAMPGGLSEMLLTGTAMGGDGRRIGLSHAARIFFVVLSIPPLLALFGYPVDTVSVGSDVPGIAETSLTSWVWLIGCAAGGILIGKVLRLPAAPFLGPMVASALIHATGLSDFETPAELIVLAQLILGTIVGCRFAGGTVREVGHILLLSIGATIIILALTLVFALTLAAISPHSFPAILLAYSPGGLVEMNLVALALNIEISFVAVHHIVRVVAVMFFAPALFAWYRRRESGG
ncbi:AbrB family transcriptional regulator [Chelativorans sp. ZYF759]|uniref:AbrB family transcriptional regulator n=1 Tax=Chelativorans sp. ZYF759 TaxID=2692213 RepID=UPI00145C8269|nr:AbrB family transcriptional regulator [Chelativorans sp. ZYF759]